MFNIECADGQVMLGQWVRSLAEADKWLTNYCTLYAPGKPYPNGKGFYPDFGFRIVVK